MDDKDDYLPGFLAHIGLKAEVRRDAKRNALIVIEAGLFNQRRGWIETFFQLIEQDKDYSYCRERVRGSEDTQ
ncbi:MAG: hypothetical protein ABI700_08560 [Chloroflexota bacterium]